jgi:epoxide hydrolase
MEPFRIDVPQRVLDDLHDRLGRTRFAPDAPGDDWDHGVPGAEVRQLVAYWRDQYDWRSWEARINKYPQFTTSIDGQNVHFLHIKSGAPDALPLILTHGWPGSIAEFLDIIEPLTSRAAPITFDLVIPSLPGFGFSGPTSEAGWGPSRIAAAWAELMRELGYQKFGAAGNDWGSIISPRIGLAAPDSVVGVHVTQIFSQFDPAELNDADPAERAVRDDLQWFGRTMDGYDYVQRQQPQSLAYALTDSPAGLVAWHSVIYRGGLDADFVLTNAMFHWLTDTVASAMRIYYEEAHDRPADRTTVPLGLAQFHDDGHAVRRIAERDHANIISWNTYDSGGHYAAHQEPELLVNDMRSFFRAALETRPHR